MVEAPSNLQNYRNQVYQEWVHGSAIAPELFFANTNVTADEIISHGGDVSYPIHEALNWQVKRWRIAHTGRLQRPEQHGTIIYSLNPVSENDQVLPRQVFQVKLESPILDKTKLKPRKYENPVGQTQIGGFAEVPLSLWQNIALKHNCPIDSAAPEVIEGTNFWSWVKNHNLPIIICEGMKKACALISQGYIAIALRGITMGRCNTGNGVALQDYLKLFATPDRQISFCFDAETKTKTKQAVHLAQLRTGKLFEIAGCKVQIIQLPLLPNTDKTGVDDLIVAKGAKAFDRLYNESLSLSSYQWQWINQHQLTYKPSLNIDVNDLSEINLGNSDIPQSGIIAIQSAKGTGKTKTIASLVANSDKLALLGHRVSLMRNLCQRLGVDYKGDIDRAEGKFIAGSAYTLRVGACVDSLLTFNPNSFADCDLVIDEVEQVLRHLISGATCNKDGKRLALIARLQLLIRSARRVIVADADLSDISLDYLTALRGDDCDPYLIQNHHKPQGYPTRFIYAKSETPIASELLLDITKGIKVFVATDSKANSKVITKLVEQIKSVRPSIRVLLINSETSGGEIESEFIRNINDQVKNYDVVIATPSMNTGVSIEKKWFDKVYGMFYGTITDADISQSLARVRDNIPRVVWCTEQGTNFSRIDRSEFPTQIKNTLKNRWDREASLIRASLGVELTVVVNGVTWENPHIDLWAKVEAANNTSMWSLRTNLLERLQYEGNIVEIINYDQKDPEDSNPIREAKQQVKQEHYQAIATAKILTKTEIKALARKETRSPVELRNEIKTAIANFYCTNQITPELVEYDRDGQRRSQILRYEALLHGDRAITSDLEAIEKQTKFNQGIFVPDQPCNLLGRFIREQLGLTNLLIPNAKYRDEDLETIGQICRECSAEIKKFLGFKVPQDATNIWIFRRLCSQLGITTKSKRVHEANRMINYCWLDQEAWNQLQEIVARREQQYTPTDTAIAPPDIENIQAGVIAKSDRLEQREPHEPTAKEITRIITEWQDTLTFATIKTNYLIETIRATWQYLSDAVKSLINVSSGQAKFCNSPSLCKEGFLG